MDAPCQDTAAGGPRGELEVSRDVEGIWDCRKVIDDAKHNGIGPRTDGNECGVKMDTLHQDGGPGGPEGKQDAMGGVKHDWKCKIDVKGVGYDGRWWEMDNAMSAAHRNSK